MSRIGVDSSHSVFDNCGFSQPKGYKFLKKSNEGLCTCGNQTGFLGIHQGYREFCSCKCAGKSKNTLEKRKKMCLEKYGVDNPAKREALSLEESTNSEAHSCRRHYVQFTRM